MTDEPKKFFFLAAKKIAEGFLIDFNPNSVMAKIPISFTDPNLFLMDLIILCVEELSPSKYNTVSTIC